jgi:hypothetical protein
MLGNISGAERLAASQELSSVEMELVGYLAGSSSLGFIFNPALGWLHSEEAYHLVNSVTRVHNITSILILSSNLLITFSGYLLP